MQELITNKPHDKILGRLIEELDQCSSFKIVVAFVTFSGVNLLLEALSRLEEKNIPGQIITGDYLNFTEPIALEKLNEFNNIEVKLLRQRPLHAKGFLFQSHDSNGDVKNRMMIGSSNLTQSALTTSIEWNTLSDASEIEIEQFSNNFQQLWTEAIEIDSCIDEYTLQYQWAKRRVMISQDNALDIVNNAEQINGNMNGTVFSNDNNIVANTMQVEALESLSRLRSSGENKGLVLSATGSGKTILAALDVKQFDAKRLLFIIHRSNVAMAAKNTFERIIPNKSFGIYNGESKEVDSDYVFATIQTLVNNLDTFKEHEFDYIIIDEVHHGGAKSYLQVINHFKPKFMLGLTATPERSDGFNIFELFDYNIAYEYHLREAMNDQILCPFHYFGVTDITVDGELITEESTINQLTSESRVTHIIEKVKLYGYPKELAKGLIFVSNVNEAKILCEKLNVRNYRCTYLSSEHSTNDRLRTIGKLENGELEYIITVDIFNEGIDIPCVNQVLLLRPTESQIVYLQQIGRGLRKFEDKEFVIILDFIGNYKNNFLIPAAISNNRTMDRDYLRDDVILNGTNVIEGASVIQFEKQVSDELIEKVTKTNFSTMANIRKDYNYLKLKYNRIPRLVDFIDNNLLSPEVIVKKKNYVEIKNQLEKETIIELTDSQSLFLDYITTNLFPSRRPHELEIVKLLLVEDQVTINEVDELISEKYNANSSIKTIQNAFDHLARDIFKSLSDEFKYIPFINKVNAGMYEVSDEFKEAIKSQEFNKEVKDIISTALTIYDVSGYNINSNLTIGNHYSRKDAYKCSLFDFNNGYQVSGQTVFGNEMIIFITLDDTNSFTKFDNKMLDNNTFTWYSKANRKLVDNKGNKTAEGKLADNELTQIVFMKRTSSDTFKYMGKTKCCKEYEIIEQGDKQVIKYTMELDV